MQTDGAGNTVTEYVGDEGAASGSIVVPDVNETELPEVEVDEGQPSEFNEISNDKSEVSDEDFRSIKTIDDNANDFEGKRKNYRSIGPLQS